MANRSGQLEQTGGNLLFLHALLEECRVGIGSRVLEIGCGTGLLASYITVCTGAIVTGTERCPELALIASRRVPCLYVPDGGLPDLAERQDLIFCKDVWPMIDEKSLFLTRIRGLLRSAGAFLTYLPEVRDFEEKPLYRFLPEARRQSLARYGTIASFAQIACEAGFSSVRTRRLVLGTIALNNDYVEKHEDGFFSNTHGDRFETDRRACMETIRHGTQLCEKEGVLLHYQWERTLVVAQ